MPILLWIILATLFGGLLSAALAGLFLLLPEARRARLLPHLISFATGAMLAAALLGLLPEAIAAVGPGQVAGDRRGAAGRASRCSSCWRNWCSGAIAIPRTASLTRCRASAHRDRAAGWIVLIGDGVHNGFDGVLIAAAFLTDVRLGILTTIAITAHEIPQELGDLAVLLHAGMKPMRALLFNTASSLTSILGGLAGYFALQGHARRCCRTRSRWRRPR